MPRRIDSAAGMLITCVVGEDWIVQRLATGELQIDLYINPYHRFLPGSAPIDLASGIRQGSRRSCHFRVASLSSIAMIMDPDVV